MPLFLANADNSQTVRRRLSLAMAAVIAAVFFAPLSPAMAKPDGERRGPPRASEDARPAKALAPEQIEARLKILAEVSPELAQRLEQLEESNPKHARRMTRRLMPRLGYLMRVKEKDPQQYELRKREMATGYRLLKQLRVCHQQHEDNKRVEEDDLQKLRGLMAAHMDARLKIRELELQRLEQKIQRVRAHIQKQRDNRDSEIDSRIEKIRNGQFPMPRGVDD